MPYNPWLLVQRLFTSSFGRPSAFDFCIGLDRIADNRDNLQDDARRELLFLRDERTIQRVPVSYEEGGSLQEDKDARDLLLRFGTEYQNTTTVQSTGNGSCLFDSLSTALTGHGGHAKELRLRTALELIINEKYYKGLYRQDVKWHCLNTSYEKAIQLCLNSRETTGWTIHAASTVLRCPIKSMYLQLMARRIPQ